jgi:hypothetical protein
VNSILPIFIKSKNLIMAHICKMGTGIVMLSDVLIVTRKRGING